MDIMHQAQWKFHTHIMINSNIHSTIYQKLTCPPWASTIARSRHGTLATNHRMCACVTLCHSLPTAARSSVSFLGNRFIQLRRLDIYNHMFSIILISGLVGGHRRTSIAVLARNSWVILAVCMTWSPILHEDTSICQCMIVNVWFNMRPEDVINISVQLDLRECQLSPACGHRWRIPWRGLPLWGRSLTSLGLAACRLKMPYAFLCGIPRRLEITGALIPFPLRAIKIQCCRIVVRGIF